MERLFKEGRIKASMAVCKGANRHTKFGLGRPEWATPKPTGGTGVRSSGVVHCTSVGSLIAEPTNVHAPELRVHAGPAGSQNQRATDVQNQNAPAWANLDHWRRLLAKAVGDREQRIGVVLEWCAAAGGSHSVDRDRVRITLPPDLKDGLALAELKSNARGLGLMPKVMFADLDGPQILSRERP